MDWDAVTADTLIENLGFDSLSILDLIYDVQQAFGITFDAEKLTDVQTVGDLAERSEAELMTIKNFGQTSLNEVKQKLAELGLSLANG